MVFQATNNRMLRTNNKRTILLMLFHKGAMSRKALASECKLTGAAITIIVKDMVEKGYLIDGEKLQQNISGRKEVMVDINYDNFLACNINIESDKIHFSLCSLKEIIRENIYLVEDMGDKINYIVENIQKVSFGYEDKMIGIGIGVVGAVDEKNGILQNSYGIFDKNFMLKEELEKIFEVPVFVCNNVRAHAKAIIDDTNKNFLYIKHGPGLGLAIAVNGEVINGFNNQAGEIGHTIVDYDGKQCKCGKKGCLEHFISEKKILESFQSEKLVTIADVYELYGKDESATKLLDECLTRLVYAIINTIALFDPEKVIVSGGIFDCNKLFERFREMIKETKSNNESKIKQLAKEIKIKGMASSRLVFNEIFFKKQ